MIIKRTYKTMRIYKLYRSTKLDHEKDRPTIFIRHFGTQSLVWIGTTKQNEKQLDKPLAINLNGINTYFYNKSLQKILTINLISRWRNNETDKIYTLSKQERLLLQEKFKELLFFLK